MKKYFILPFCLLNYAVFAQVDSKKMDVYLSQLEKHNKAMMGVALYQNGNQLYKNSIGYLNVEKQIKSNANTLFHIGSLSKMYTAVLIFQLCEEKKLRQDTRLKTFFPGIPNADKITIAQMLNHSSGIHNFTSDENYSSYMIQYQSDEALLERFSNMPSEFEPGSKHDYSNTAYVLLSMIIEKVSGKKFNEVLKENICRKIGLTNTMIAGKIALVKNTAASYNYQNEQWIISPETDASIPKGAGAIMSTPSEVCLFIQALFDNKLISASSLKEMTNLQQDHGKGIFQFPFKSNKAYGHTGAIDDFQACVGYFPHNKQSFCLLGNGFDYNMNDITIGILSIANNLDFSIPTFEKKAIDPASLKTIYGNYSNSKMGMTIQIFEKEGKTMAQAAGQSAFPLDKVNDTEYKFEQAGIVLEFPINDNGDILKLILKQAGNVLDFGRE